jgi:hypothetical protein
VTFLNPMLALVGVACVAAPIIIHILMRRRRRPVAWGAMRFLIEAARRQRRRTNLEQMLLLASRCLLVAVLAMALGKPVLGALGLGVAGGPRTLVLVIDDSLAALATDAEGVSDLDRAKRRALALIDGLDASRGDRVALVTMSSPAEAVVMPASAEFTGVREMVASLAGTHARADVGGALALVAGEGSLASAKPEVVVLSAFRVGSAPVETALPRLGIDGATLRVLTPATGSVENVQVTGVEPLRRMLLGSGGGGVVSTPVRVHLRRMGAGAGGVTRVRLTGEGVGGVAGESPRAEAVHTWTPGQRETSVALTIELPAGVSAQGRVVLRAEIDRDALGPDNAYRRAVAVRERLEVGLVTTGGARAGARVDAYDAGDWLALALAPETDLGVRRRQGGELRLSVFDPARPGLPASTGLALRESDAVLIARPDLLDDAGWEEVARAWLRGAPVLVVAPDGVQTHLWGDAFAARFGLEWSLPREARTLGQESGIVHTREDAGGLLTLLNAEMAELTRTVRVRRVLAPEGPPGSFEALLALADGTPLLVASTPGGRAPVIYLGTSLHLAWTDLPTRPLMVPLVQELVRQGVGRAGGVRQGLAGGAVSLPEGAVELARQGTETDGPVLARVGVDGRTTPAIRHAGVYGVRGSGGTPLGLLAVNPDVAAGQTDPTGRDAVERWLAGTGAPVTWLDGSVPAAGGGERAGQGSPTDAPPISPYLLIAALVLALIETVFARVFSHARVDDIPGQESA